MHNIIDTKYFKIYGDNKVNNVKIKNIIPYDIYQIIYTQGYRPIKMIHSNYWIDKNLPFNFVLCKNIGENIYYYDKLYANINDNFNEYFLFFNHDTHYFLGRRKNINNNGLNKKLSRFCCNFEYDDYIYQISEAPNLIDNSFIITKIDN